MCQLLGFAQLVLLFVGQSHAQVMRVMGRSQLLQLVLLSDGMPGQSLLAACADLERGRQQLSTRSAQHVYAFVAFFDIL